MMNDTTRLQQYSCCCCYCLSITTNVFTCCNHIGITLYIYLSLSVVTEIFETTPQAADGRPWSDTAAAACYYANAYVFRELWLPFWVFVMGGPCMDLDMGILYCAEVHDLISFIIDKLRWGFVGGGCLTWWWSCLSVIGQDSPTDSQVLIITCYCESDLKVNILFISH